MLPIDPSQSNTKLRSFYPPSSITAKCRVVFDGFSKIFTGISLNEGLMVCPTTTVQDTLYSIVLRFRPNEIAVVAEITKMYRQIWVHPYDLHLQRILWKSETVGCAVGAPTTLCSTAYRR